MTMLKVRSPGSYFVIEEVTLGFYSILWISQVKWTFFVCGISHLQHLLSINSLCDQSVVSIAEAICAISVLLDLNGNLPRISLAA